MPQRGGGDAIQFSKLRFAGIERKDTQRAVHPDQAPGVRIACDLIVKGTPSFAGGAPPRTGMTQNGDEGNCCAAARVAANAQIKPASFASDRMATIVADLAEERISLASATWAATVIGPLPDITSAFGRAQLTSPIYEHAP